MDPLSISATAISLVETGLKIKESVDKVTKVRSRARELSRDVLDDLLRIAAFCELNKDHLSHITLGPLCHSLDALKSDMHHAHIICLRYERKSSDGTLSRLAAGIKLWIDSEEIEALLAGLKERIHTSLSCITFLTCARVEIGIMKLQEVLLVHPHDVRSRVQQLDRVFAQRVHDGDSGFNPLDALSTEIDYIDLQYIGLKANKIVEVLFDTTRFPMDVFHVSLSRIELSPDLHLIGVHNAEDTQSHGSFCADIVSTLTQLWVGIYPSNRIDPNENMILLTLNAARMLRAIGSSDVALSLCDSLECLFRSARISQVSLRADIFYLFLNQIITLKAIIILTAAQSTRRKEEAVGLMLQAVDVYRVQLPFITGQHFLLASNLHFLNSAYHCLGYAEECAASCLESLDLLNTVDCPDDYSYACVLQLYSFALYHLSFARKRTGHFTEAFHAGIQCMAASEELLSMDFCLPFDFKMPFQERAYLKYYLPAFTSIVRGPVSGTSWIEEHMDDEDDGDASDRDDAEVEWGIAI
ncbi:hypothetical protein ONZ45_g18644 [Pleurotus djamor]|nr:hypothetical protein ONZ45_g18644 [Pleurotus djamor]